MIEITRQITGIAKRIAVIDDVVDVLKWGYALDGISVSVTATVDGQYVINCGGVTVDTVSVPLGSWVMFDGDRFAVLSDEQFAEQGFVNDGEAAGPAGATGPTGASGDTGATGAVGATGE